MMITEQNKPKNNRNKTKTDTDDHKRSSKRGAATRHAQRSHTGYCTDPFALKQITTI